MKQTLLLAALLFSLCVSAQKKVLLDTAKGTGLYIREGFAKPYQIKYLQAVVDSANKVDPGWKLPTLKQMEAIFKATFNKQKLVCMVEPGTYYSSESEKDETGDMPVTGVMYGRNFEGGYGDYRMGYKVFLVKEF